MKNLIFRHSLLFVFIDAVLKSNPEMLPEVIVIYRTGVPDGKLHYIFVAEFQNEWVEAVKLIRRQTGNMKYEYV